MNLLTTEPTTKVSYYITHFFLTLLLTTSTISNAEYFTAKRAGQGFTDITQDFTSSLSNPALLTKYTNNDDIYFSLNLGFIASDKYDVIDTGERIATNLDMLADDINSQAFQDLLSLGEATSFSEDLHEQVDTIVNDLTAIDNKHVNGQNGASFQIIIPNSYLSFGLFTNQYGKIGGLVDYVESDEQLLRQAIETGFLDLDKLDSNATGLGYSIAEAGIMTGGNIVTQENYQVSVGMKLKYQRIDVFFNSINISDFDDDEFDLSNEDNITGKSSTNVDIGLYMSFGEQNQWHAALVTNNIISQQVTHTERDLTFSLEANSVLGLSYQNDWLTIATEVDLTEREQFDSLKAAKYASIGAEYIANQYLQFRLGYRADLNDIDADIFTAGLGIMPWDVLTIDLAAFTGDQETYGAAIQFGLKL